MIITSDSINFKNEVIKSIDIELSEFGKDIEEMIIEEGFGYDFYGNLVIENYPNLEKIIVKKNSLKNLYSLKICNNEKLKIIEIENGQQYLTNGAFYNINFVRIESIFFYD